MKRVVIFGGTGFIGRNLVTHLKASGMEPVVVARHQPKQVLGCLFEPWDAVTLGPWQALLEGADAIVNLVGKTVDCIKTPDNCDLILRSRVDATKVIGEALRRTADKPRVWVQMSTAHIYGDPPKQLCTETSSTGYGLAPFVGKAWEAAFLDALPSGMRGIRLRTSFVIGKDGGALPVLRRIAQFGLGGTVASGTQGMSWIHADDMSEIMQQAIINDAYEGMLIASAPNPVSNKEFMRELRSAMGMPIGLPGPEFMIRMGARLFFRTDPELVLYGRYVKSERLPLLNYTFRFPELRGALEDLLA